MLIRHFRDPHLRFSCAVEAGAGADAGAGGGGAGAGAGSGAGSGGGGGAGSGAGAGNGAGGGAGDPFYAPYVAELDKGTLAWLDGKRFPDVKAALKSGAEAERMFRERNVIAAPDPAKLADWEGWGKLGWNPDRSKYGSEIKPPKMPDGAQHDAALMDDFVGLAHELRVPPAMAEKLFHGLTDKVNGRLSALASEGIRASEKLDEQLRTEWGTDYDMRVERAQRAAKAFGIGADASSELEKIVGAPRLLKMFDTIGAKIGEANLVGADGLGGTAGMTPATAEAELRRLEGDANFLKPFMDPRHPQHEDHKKQWQRLVDIVAKGKKQ